MGALIELDRNHLADAGSVIGGIRDIDRRVTRLHAYDQADQLLHEATALWHSFTWEDVEGFERRRALRCARWHCPT
jgi:hypothetical protein